MIDILDKIKPLLTFNSTDDFYFLQILMRKKDNPELKSNGRVIKNYYIKSLERLEEYYDEIKKLCQMFNARASLRLNKRSFKKVALQTIQLIANNIVNDDYEFAKKSYDRASGRGHNDKDKKWILDLDDSPTEQLIKDVIHSINMARPEGEKCLVKLPTKSGIHLITKPFDLRDFSSKFPTTEIHKDNPINLYIP